MRSNYNFTMLLAVKTEFGSCPMKIDNRKVEPPLEVRERIARTYLYMDDTYSRYSTSKAQNQLMNAWNKMYPVSDWECERADRIKNIQGNQNNIMSLACKARD